MSGSVEKEISELSRNTPRVHLEHPAYPELAAFDPSAEEEWRRKFDADGKTVILFFGNIRTYKGLADLIEAFAIVRRSKPAVLVVAGQFLERPNSYLDLISKLGLEADTRVFAEYVPNEQVGALLRAADLLVLPYRSGSQSGIVPLAAAAGTPVVATDIEGIRGALGSGARVSPPRRPDLLAEAIVEAIRCPPAAPPIAGSWTTWVEALLTVAPRTETGANAKAPIRAPRSGKS